MKQKHLLFIILLLAGALPVARGQILNVKFKDGSSFTQETSQIRKITHSVSELKILGKDLSMTWFKLSDIQNITHELITGNERKTATTSLLSLYPNPADEYLKLNYPAKDNDEIVIQILDSNGKVLETRNEIKSPGSTSTYLNVQNYLPGIYFITINSSDNYFTEKFLVY
jgi:hypothetical protein